MNHYPRHIGDYLRKTIGLTLAQDGAYTRMLDLYYGDERPLSTNRQSIYDDVRCRCKADRDAVDFVLRKYFTETPDGFTHDRCDEEIAKYADKLTKARAAGEASGQARSTKKERTFNGRSTDVQPDQRTGVERTPNQPEPEPEPEPLTRTRTINPNVNPVPVAPKPRAGPPTTDERRAQARAVWQAYADAYHSRYGVEPVRNAKVNSAVLGLLERIPAADAPHVAASFVRSNAAFYVRGGHTFGLLLADAEKLRTEWATGNSVTDTQARQVDRTAATGNTFGKLINEVRNGTEG